MAENRIFPTTSSHVRGDIELDIHGGDEEVLCLCVRLKVERRRSIQGFQDYKELSGPETPEALKR